MKIEVSLPLNVLRAAATHAADGDIRRYLCGVYLDFSRGKVVATDGHRLLCVTVPTVRAILPHGGPDAAVQEIRDGIIIPNETIAAALAAYRGATYKPTGTLGAAQVAVTVEWDNREESGVLHYGVVRASIVVPSGILNFTPVNIDFGKFPEYWRVMPRADQLGAFQYAVVNPAYLADAHKALCMVAAVNPASNFPPVYYRGENSALMPGFASAECKALVVVMPVRAGAESDARGMVVAELLAAHDSVPVPARTDADADAVAA